MFPDAEKPDAETPDAEDFTTPTDVSDYYCDASAYETRTASCLQPWLHTSRADRVCFTSSRILTFLNALQIQVEWSWSRKFMFQLLIFVFVGEQVGQKVTKPNRDPSSGMALQEISFWLNLERALLKIQEKRESVEVALILDILKHGKRFHNTVFSDTDNGLKQRMSSWLNDDGWLRRC